MKADFLTRLAERTLGLTPVAQPLIAPMFAPMPTIEGESLAQSRPGESSLATLASDGGIPAQNLGSGREQASSQRAARAPDPTSRARDFPPDSLSPPSASKYDDKRFAPRPVGNQDISTEQGQPEHMQMLVNLQSSSSISPMPSEIDALSAIIPVEADVPVVPIRDRRRLSAPTITSDQNIQSEEFPAAASHSFSAAETLVPLPHRGQQSNAPIPFADATSPSAAALHYLFPDEGAAGGPTIHVTIGRIEVRAVMPPQEVAARPPTTRPAPALSLDDYLRQQSKGGQR